MKAQVNLPEDVCGNVVVRAPRGLGDTLITTSAARYAVGFCMAGTHRPEGTLVPHRTDLLEMRAAELALSEARHA